MEINGTITYSYFAVIGKRGPRKELNVEITDEVKTDTFAFFPGLFKMRYKHCLLFNVTLK